MPLIKGALAILITLAIAGIGSAFAQDATNKLQPLVETSARRLVLAKQVALAKWDSQAPVEDTAREAEVITAAIKDGDRKCSIPCWVGYSKYQHIHPLCLERAVESNEPKTGDRGKGQEISICPDLGRATAKPRVRTELALNALWLRKELDATISPDAIP
jgi:hypothetical protein